MYNVEFQFYVDKDDAWGYKAGYRRIERIDEWFEWRRREWFAEP
ncbi:MAG: hypothetical protein U5R06_13135 [candidate division KSB1 bacterium]|nr:hypothetical protein [candidate division KSB1 bacterium]